MYVFNFYSKITNKMLLQQYFLCDETLFSKNHRETFNSDMSVKIKRKCYLQETMKQSLCFYRTFFRTSLRLYQLIHIQATGIYPQYMYNSRYLQQPEHEPLPAHTFVSSRHGHIRLYVPAPAYNSLCLYLPTSLNPSYVDPDNL
jgi:hypothetical protein